MRTRAYHAFESKLLYFNDDVDLIEILCIGVYHGEMNDASLNYPFKYIDPLLHKHISRRKCSEGTRTLLINHLRQTVYSSYVKDIYEEVTIYLRTILEQAAMNGLAAGRLIGEHASKFDAKSILLAGNWATVTKLIADSVFESLEAEKSTLKLIKKISDKLALEINDSLISSALPYLEIRHFLVHTDGLVPHEFRIKHKTIKYTRDGYVKLDHSFVTELRKTIENLIQDFDAKIICNHILNPDQLMN